jgi:hypothetical protein
MADLTTIQARSSGGPLSVTVASPRFPQNVSGVLWRYDASQQPEGEAGRFGPGAETVALGMPASVAGKLFMIEGAVLHQNDNPPTPYEVEVTVSQNGTVLARQVPAEGGSGQIGGENQPFVYRFTIREEEE